ncbi:MBL fold metallo-hydrolase [Saccharopolyspora erythraea]|nr:MBL fold metallo-hydrolase [Saccharopolyspora erythraea]QUH03425.1 MBL fold metallo-hydrolase [Saccharopolyspora erythraea]
MCGNREPLYRAVVEIFEVVPGLHRIRFSGTPAYLLNAYLWLDEREVTLIDAGDLGHAPQILSALERVGRSPAELRRIVLTHYHVDHTGAAAELVEATGATVVAGAADAPYVRGELPGPPPVLTDAERPLFEQATPEGKSPQGPPCRVDHEVSEGDVLPFAGGCTVLELPGHTPGSIGLHLPRQRVLLTGDTVAGSPGGPPILGGFNVDRDQTWRSLRRLAELDVDVACFGHGDPFHGDVAAALRNAEDPLG